MFSILNKNRDDLKQDLSKLQIKPFRTDQIFNWIYKNKKFDFNKMHNLAKNDINLLNETYSIVDLKLMECIKQNESNVIKYIFQTKDQYNIETVFIKSFDRNTLCVSTQVGCGLGCTFCATGKMGFKRDLETSEIISQVLLVNNMDDSTEIRVNNIVFMGMGEPFLNYDAVLRSIYILNDPKAYNLGMRHMTISTAGIIKGITRFSSENHQIKLAVSLHSPFQKTREEIMPVSKKDRLPDLINTLKRWQQKSNKRITFEYLLLKNINMDEKDVKELKRLLKGIKYTINLIKYNSIKESDEYMPNIHEIKKFIGLLKEYQIPFTQRYSKGDSIKAGCGQLGYNQKSRTKN